MMTAALTSSRKGCSLEAYAFLASPNECMWYFKDKPRVILLRLIGFDISPSKAEGMQKCETVGLRPC